MNTTDRELNDLKQYSGVSNTAAAAVAEGNHVSSNAPGINGTRARKRTVLAFPVSTVQRSMQPWFLPCL